jgi:hypothetical protein
LQTLYKWSTDESVYVDRIHHSCGMWWHHVKSSFATTCCMWLTHANDRILVVHVSCNLFLVANYSYKLRFFFWCELVSVERWTYELHSLSNEEYFKEYYLPCRFFSSTWTIFLPHRLNISSTWTKYSFWWMKCFVHVNETYSTL